MRTVISSTFRDLQYSFELSRKESLKIAIFRLIRFIDCLFDLRKNSGLV
jgi:hypothetical protein